jgi:acyl-CoA thioester hydrolase
MNDATRRLLHSIPVTVRWGDMDAVGHVNNARYFTYFEQARIGWLAAHGMADTVSTAIEGPVIANASCTFLLAIVYPADLLVHMFGGPPGRSSFNTWFEIRDAHEPSRLYAEGESRMVWINRHAAQSVPVPDHVRALLPEG